MEDHHPLAPPSTPRDPLQQSVVHGIAKGSKIRARKYARIAKIHILPLVIANLV